MNLKKCYGKVPFVSVIFKDSNKSSELNSGLIENSMIRNYALIVLIVFSISGVFIEGREIQINSSSNLLITEVLYDAPNNDNTEEWIELYNPTGSMILLEGWVLSDNFNSFSLTGTILSGGYFVIARDSTAFTALYGSSPDIGDCTLALGNSGDVLRLIDSSSSEVDMVAWENYITGWDIAIKDSTIIRKNILDTDSVDDWEVTNS
ncbi:MAG: lamin tail domain-containing protein, partial [Candidatus Kariarchaeaceae archaeon]